MHRRKFLGAASAGVLSLVALGAGAVLLAPWPPAAAGREPAPLAVHAHLAAISTMRPPKRSRPVVAVVGANDGTETTDYLIPYAVLAESGVAEVIALAVEDRPLKLRPALTIQPQATVAAFDARFPDGADYVIVPAIADREDPAVEAWVRAQSEKGAIVVGVCAGTITLSRAGLLRGRAATGHWHDVKALQKANPDMRWVRDRRYVVDRGVVTTTGVSASLPVSLALVEAIAGRERATAVAARFGVSDWDARHDSAAYSLRPALLRVALANKAAVWSRQTLGVPVSAGVDELELGFMADAWSRTFRSQALTVAEGQGGVPTRRGLTLIPDRTSGDRTGLTMLPAPGGQGAAALPAALEGIRRRYGDGTAAFVALQLEYPWRPAGVGGGR